jgi:dTDP-3-amino-3,4,6-trideoxy-alpha-D-glucose transaminase
MSVPLFASSLDPFKARLVEKLAEVVDGGRYILGPEVDAFESEFASFLGVKHCVGVANGTDAITIALRSMGVRPGDEVVCPSYTFWATVEAAINAGATPVYCDVDPETACVTPETVSAAVTPRTRAVIAVHLYGNVAPVPELAQLGLPVLEDAAQAVAATLGGVRAGALGTAATFSFFPSKNLPCLGDGGAIVTDDDDVAAIARRLRFHGSADKQAFVDVGYNSRLDEMQAATLRILLPELDGWTAARREAAATYERLGLGDHVQLPRPVEGAEPAYHLYVVRSDRADALAGALSEQGIGARGYYRVPSHLQPGVRHLLPDGLELPGTDELARTGLALPMGTGLSEDDVREVVQAVGSAGG